VLESWGVAAGEQQRRSAAKTVWARRAVPHLPTLGDPTSTWCCDLDDEAMDLPGSGRDAQRRRRQVDNVAVAIEDVGPAHKPSAVTSLNTSSSALRGMAVPRR
jgi:hypothetical protein